MKAEYCHWPFLVFCFFKFNPRLQGYHSSGCLASSSSLAHSIITDNVHSSCKLPPKLLLEVISPLKIHQCLEDKIHIPVCGTPKPFCDLNIINCSADKLPTPCEIELAGVLILTHYWKPNSMSHPCKDVPKAC